MLGRLPACFDSGGIERALSDYKYAEIRLEHGVESGIRIVDDEIKATGGAYGGMSARVLKNGAWGFASTNRPCEPARLLKVAEGLCALQKGSIRTVHGKTVRKTIEEKAVLVQQEEQIRALLEAKKCMAANAIRSKRLSCSDVVVYRQFYNSDGSAIVQKTGYTYLGCTAIAKKGAVLERGVERAASRQGFQHIDANKTAEGAVHKALRLLDAGNAKKGRATVVLDPEMTGVFSHEAVGHASEADAIIEKESILAGKHGMQIGSRLVTIVDDPSARYFGQYHYDDEGNKGERTVILKNGRVSCPLNSGETAHRLKARLNGHARAMDFHSVPIVRMSNTFFLPGKASMEDVFDLRSGIYVKGMKGGSVDTFSGGFMFKAEESYEIKNGETGRVLKGVALSGNILDTLKSVVCVGRDFGTSPGICGKMWQEAPVEDGGPHIRVENMMVG